MQDVAKEAGMSAGNLYRYFVSKDQLVSGLCERDRERFGADFQHVGEADDVMAALVALGRQHFVEEPRSRCVQFMEIWAEATRNPAVAEVCATIDGEVHSRLVGIIEAAKAAGQVPDSVDSDALVTVISALGDGLFMRRALDPDFDANEGFRLLLAVLDGIVAGKIDLDRPDPDPRLPRRPTDQTHAI
jgi:AcrR family transcriptional regulator